MVSWHGSLRGGQLFLLISKLSKFALPSKSVDWFKSYLLNRSQRVNLDGYLSEYQSVDYGVPQGSVLGPILFNIFINDLANHVNNDLQMCADDSTIFYSDPNILQLKLDRVYNCCQTNLLTLNIQKTKWMLVGSQRQRSISQHKFEIAGTQLERVTSYKYLGLLLDENLDFREQRRLIMCSLS